MLKIWQGMFFNPGNSLKELKPDTKITAAIWTIIFLVILSSSILLPIITSNEYYTALYRVVVRQQEDSGKELGENQKDQMEKYLHSGLNKTIQIFSSLFGKLVYIFLFNLLLSALFLWWLSALFKLNISFAFSFRILICLCFLSCLELIIVSSMVVFADWHLSLSNVQSMKEFTAVLTAYTSLAVIFEISEIGAVPFLILNYLTNIFTYLYFSLFYLVLTKSVNVEKKQAIIVTVIYAIISGLMYILLSLPYIFM